VLLPYLFFFFFEQRRGQRPQRSNFHLSTYGRYKLQQGPLSSLALNNQLFEEETLQFTQSTLARNVEKQSSAFVPLPPHAGELEASPPSSESCMLESPTPARGSSFWQPPGARGRTTWVPKGVEHQQIDRRASKTEVEDGSPC
jgi:hypothetical protein